ncbi:hypothetical protein E5359_017820 [Bacteroidales bacterium]|nr:hypothetical protein E5359_017820 [Bacteroidales bacterium]
MEEIMSITNSIAQHIGAGMRYFFLRIVCRRKDVSYKKLCNSDKKNPLAYNDNAFANGCLGMIVIAVLIILMVKYLG